MAKKTSNGKAKPSKKKLYSLIAGTVLVIVIVAFAAYYWESGTTIAKITQFSKTLGGTSPDQVLYKFSVKVENQGTNDINGLTLKVSILGDGIQIGGENSSLESLHRGQEFTNNDWGIWVNITDIGSKTITFAATLELDNKKIDEMTLTS